MSTPTSPGEVVTAFMQAAERKDVDAAAALVTDDISYENMPIDPIVGRDAMVATLNMFLGAAKTVEWVVLRQMEAGTIVMNERVDRFEIGSGWLELPVAGVFEVAATGRISLWRDYFDMGAYQKQFAALTSSGGQSTMDE